MTHVPCVPSSCFRLSWHGWPVSEALAQEMGCGVLDVGKLHKAHEMCGSGFFLPCTFAALMSFLACVELTADKCTVPRPLPIPTFHRVRVCQNGRCFLACIFLFRKCKKEFQYEWSAILRSSTSMPLSNRSGQVDQQRLKYEERCVLFDAYICPFSFAKPLYIVTLYIYL